MAHPGRSASYFGRYSRKLGNRFLLLLGHERRTIRSRSTFSSEENDLRGPLPAEAPPPHPVCLISGPRLSRAEFVEVLSHLLE